jgi:hypothetical protein
MATYNPDIARMVADVVAATPLPAAFDDLDRQSQRALAREAEARGVRPAVHYAEIVAEQKSRRSDADAVSAALAAISAARPGVTRSTRV